MFNLRKPKDQIIKAARRFQEQVRQLENETKEKLGPLVQRDEDHSNQALLLKLLAGHQGEGSAIRDGVRAARRMFRLLRKEFEVLAASALARNSLADYQDRNRVSAALVGSTSAANLDILLNDFDNFCEEIDHFIIEVESSEDVAPDSVATKIDVGIIVALPEEFRVLRSILRLQEPERRNDRYYYPVDAKESGLGSLKVITNLIGEMGPTTTAVAASDFFRYYEPRIIAIVGIAGSLDSDLVLGDVVVAKGVDHYAGSMKAVDAKDDYELLAGGPILRPSPRIIQIVTNMEFAHPAAFSDWQKACAKLLEKAPAVPAGMGREAPIVRAEVIASGSTVSASEEFNKWLRTSRNREIKCIEMESIGLALAAEAISDAELLVVRGISDMADSRKAELESTSRNFYRDYAMRNATQFLAKLLSLPEVTST